MIGVGEAAAQLAYVRRIREQTRLRLASGHPQFIIWGLAWIMGFVGSGVDHTGYWWAAFFVALAPSAAVGWGNRGRSPQRINGPGANALFLSFIALAVLPVLFIHAPTNATYAVKFDAYFPFSLGVLYLLVGQWLGRAYQLIGAWLIAVSCIALGVGGYGGVVFIGAGAGGAMILNGLWLRHLIRRPAPR